MIGYESRYRNCLLYRDGTEEFLGSRSFPAIAEEADDILYTVREGDRVDLLAAHFYGREDLYWIVCDYNAIAFPLELPVGTTLRLPSPERVFLSIIA